MNFIAAVARAELGARGGLAYGGDPRDKYTEFWYHIDPTAARKFYDYKSAGSCAELPRVRSSSCSRCAGPCSAAPAATAPRLYSARRDWQIKSETLALTVAA